MHITSIIIIIYSFLEALLINYISSIYETNVFIFENYFTLLEITTNQAMLSIGTIFVSNFVKTTLLWFPWVSFFNYLTLLGLMYVLVFLSIYLTENSYYIVLYTLFLVGLFAVTLVLLDLDIFAGFLLLIESVVILMLFFLIIYLTPNIGLSAKIQKWKVWSIGLIFIFLISSISYVNLGGTYFSSFSLIGVFLEDYYEALNDLTTTDLTGVFLNMYWTNSLLLIVVGILLLVASIICVVLVSFFTKMRTYNTNVFLDIFNIAKTCYTLIFLRKQNLSKQGRSTVSTRIVNKKTFNESLHQEYRNKQTDNK